jgi:hypothetical protein
MDSLSWRDVAWALAVVCMAIIGFIVNGMNKLLGKTVERVDHLDKHSVSRDELAEAFEQMRRDRKEMHEENKESLRRIEDRLERMRP